MTMHQKGSFPWRICSGKVAKSADSSGKILNGKIHFLYSVKYILTLTSIMEKEEFVCTCQKILTRYSIKKLFTNCNKEEPEETC